MAQPRDEAVAAARAQHLLRGPECVAPRRRLYERKLREIYAGGGERRGVRQVRRGEPDNALAGPGQRAERRYQELQLPRALGVGQELGERADRPPAAGQLIIECQITG